MEETQCNDNRCNAICFIEAKAGRAISHVINININNVL